MTPEARATYIVGCIRNAADIHVTEAERLLAEHDAHRRTEVLTKAADFVSASGTGFPVAVRNGVGWAVRTLRRLAEETTTGGATPAPAGESTQPASDFFQPGRTYTDGNGFRAPETLTIFRVETVTRHPSRGTLRAIGWAKIGAAPGGTWHGYFLDEGEFKGWAEYAEGEAPRD